MVSKLFRGATGIYWRKFSLVNKTKTKCSQKLRLESMKAAFRTSYLEKCSKNTPPSWWNGDLSNVWRWRLVTPSRTYTNDHIRTVWSGTNVSLRGSWLDYGKYNWNSGKTGSLIRELTIVEVNKDMNVSYSTSEWSGFWLTNRIKVLGRLYGLKDCLSEADPNVMLRSLVSDRRKHRDCQ